MTCRACAAPLAPEFRFCPICATPAAGAETAGAGDDPERALAGALGTQYEVLRLLGRGGMGAVYLARERFLERLVAVKVMTADAAGAADAKERFRREARTAARLTHPNIVPLFTFGESRGLLFFVMGFVQGESLSDRLRREGALPAGEARRILAELADALDYAHRQGVVHRDIKPDNILVDDATGRAMLTDFGVAKAAATGQTLTVVGTVVGTPQYMSPEQAAGDRDVDGRSDLYSLGLLGYAMLSGRPPFAGMSVQEILVQQVTKEPPPLRALVPDLPADLELAIGRCLRKDPAERWPDGRAFKAALAGEAGAEELPEHLETLPSMGFIWLGFAYVLLHLALGTALAGRKGWPGLLATAAFIQFPWMLAAARARRAGASWRQALRLIFRPPRWWIFPWPRALRRPDDFRDRLPRTVRIVRALAYWPMIVLVAFLGVYITHRVAGVRPRGPIKLLWDWFVPLFYAPYFGTMLFLAAWARRRGLSRGDAMKLWGRPAIPGAFWKRPEIARLLEPASGGAGAAGASPRGPRAEPRTPHEMLRAIADGAQALSGPVREAGTDAVIAARALVSAIEALDREIEAAARDADPAEVERLEHRLAALGDAAPGEPEAQRRMRALLAGQHDLVRSLLTERDAARARRGRLVHSLEGLWRQVHDMGATAADAGSGAARALSALSAAARAEVSGERLAAG